MSIGVVRTYKIATVADFANVPADRIDACLSEFAEWCVIARAMATRSPSEKVVVTPSAFTWTDDGEPGIKSITVEIAEQ